MNNSDKENKKNSEETIVVPEGKRNRKIVIILIIGIFILLGSFSLMFFPKIKLNGNSYIKLTLNDTYKEKGASASIVGKDISNSLKTEGKVDTSKPGKYKIVYTVKNGLVSKKIVRIVEVVDDVLPKINLKGKAEVTICPNSEYVEEGYTALDNYDGDITDSVVVTKNEHSYIYSIEDSSKNKFQIERKIVKKDIEKPVISLKGNTTKYLMIGSKYNEEGYAAIDNCSGNLNDKVEVNGSVNTNKKGTYVLAYKVSDESGNITTVERKVIVYDKSSPDAGTNKTGTIYLTFDDGPSKSITPEVLKILKEKNVKATFFVINKSNDLNYLIKQAYDEGHTIGLHSYTHNYKTIYSSSNAYFNDLEKISNKVKNITGQESKIIRFPGGGSNTVSKKYSKGIMNYLTNEVINRGYHYFDWNVGSGDAGGSNNETQVYNSVIKGLKYNRANIVLMHDFENNYKTLNALSDIIDYGYAKGYKFLAIDMTTPLVRHKINN